MYPSGYMKKKTTKNTPILPLHIKKDSFNVQREKGVLFCKIRSGSSQQAPVILTNFILTPKW